MVEEIREPYSVKPEVAIEDNIKALSFLSFEAAPESDYIKSRKVLFFNNDIAVGVAAPTSSMTDYFFKNSDADELIYFPKGVTQTLEEYDRNNIHIVQPYGYEMYSENFPTGSGQIYDEVKHGARDDRWYSKPILFAPKRITKLEFAPGAHQCHVTPKLGERYLVDNKNHKFTVPTCWLLHCKHLGPIARVGKKYDVQRTRLAEINVKQKWGNFDPGEKHARDKRAHIINKLEKIF
jgi:hypothetical protein